MFNINIPHCKIVRIHFQILEPEGKQNIFPSSMENTDDTIRGINS